MKNLSLVEISEALSPDAEDAVEVLGKKYSIAASCVGRIWMRTLDKLPHAAYN